jgi:hypothetical protein
MNHIHRMHRHAILAVLLFGVAGCASSSLPLRPGVGECEAVISRWFATRAGGKPIP